MGLHDYTVIDLETTGLDPSVNEIIQLSAVRVRENCVCDTFDSFVRPTNPIPPFITGLTGIGDKTVSEAPPIGKIIYDFLDFCDEDIIVGHNVSFDIGFIIRNAAFAEFPIGGKADTADLARVLLPDLASRKLVDLARHFGISSSGAHNSLNDCMMTYGVAEHLMELIQDQP